ncbi:MAG: exodeoxyribonuclease VII small subunit [Thermodesulfobacteriota bacterium]|nr:exodeoxyribonuclease VII small subunit [Thermodesulfobacteriota bacterium]
MVAKKTFEESMEQLEEIVKELESGQLPLEKAIKKFEQGMKHSQFCFKKLDETEKRVRVLLKDNQGNIKEDFFEEDNDGLSF